MDERSDHVCKDEETKEYATFTIIAKDGSEVEMAVVDEFEYLHKHYVVVGVVKDDEIQGDGRYIYKVRLEEADDFSVEKIMDADKYNEIAQAYMAMEDEWSRP